MITVEEALSIIHSNTADYGTEFIPLNEAVGRTLREDIVADRDFPPYDRVTMDGIAISFEQFANGQRQFNIEGVAAAGSPMHQLTDKAKCLEVMTGAILPQGVDTVIRYEDITIVDNIASIDIDHLNFQQNIHFKGMDRKQNSTILKTGKILSTSEVGVCATVGKHMIKVSKLPNSLIISSGDELVEIDEQPAAHQIRRSNVYRLETLLKSHKIPVTTAHLRDNYDEIVVKLKNAITSYDLIILSGGVSKGKFDFLPKALEEVGVQKLFHKIKQRPGKPFWFGKYGNQTTIFAFPGNPVSSFMCAQFYFIDWLNKSMQSTENERPYAELSSDVKFKPDLTYFLEVKLSFSKNGKILAHPIKGNGSGDLANLVDADAFIQLPQGQETFNQGDCFPFFSYRTIC